MYVQIFWANNKLTITLLAWVKILHCARVMLVPTVNHLMSRVGGRKWELLLHSRITACTIKLPFCWRVAMSQPDWYKCNNNNHSRLLIERLCIGHLKCAKVAIKDYVTVYYAIWRDKAIQISINSMVDIFFVLILPTQWWNEEKAIYGHD